MREPQPVSRDRSRPPVDRAMVAQRSVIVFHTMRLVAIAIFCALATVQYGPRSQAQENNQKAQERKKLESLKEAADILRNQYYGLGGPKAIADIQYRMMTRKSQIDRIEDRLPDLVDSVATLESMKKQIETESIMGLEDLIEHKEQSVLTEGAKRALERVEKKAAGTVVRGFSAVAEFIGEIVELAGRKIIKELNVDQLEELVKQGRLTVSDALRIQIALLRDNDVDRKLLNELVDLKRRYEEAYHQYWMEEQRQKRTTKKKLPSCSQDFVSESKNALTGARRDLREAKRTIFRAIANAPRYGAQFAFLLRSGNVFDVHEEKLESIITQMKKDGAMFDCRMAGIVRAGVSHIQVITKRLQMYIGYNKDNRKLLDSLVADAKKLNSKTYF
jgi:hypothetical protein